MKCYAFVFFFFFILKFNYLLNKKELHTKNCNW